MKDNYDGFMDPECIELCDKLNEMPELETFESCSGHLKERFSIFFYCYSFKTLAILYRCVNRNYSDGKWELLVDGNDVHPCNGFWLRSIKPFKSYDVMTESVHGLIDNINYWLDPAFDEYFTEQRI